VSTLLAEAVLVHPELFLQLLLPQLVGMEDMAGMALPQAEPPQVVLHQVALSPATRFQVSLLQVAQSQLVAPLPAVLSQVSLLQVALSQLVVQLLAVLSQVYLLQVALSQLVAQLLAVLFPAAQFLFNLHQLDLPQAVDTVAQLQVALRPANQLLLRLPQLNRPQLRLLLSPRRPSTPLLFLRLLALARSLQNALVPPPLLDHAPWLLDALLLLPLLQLRLPQSPLLQLNRPQLRLLLLLRRPSTLLQFLRPLALAHFLQNALVPPPLLALAPWLLDALPQLRLPLWLQLPSRLLQLRPPPLLVHLSLPLLLRPPQSLLRL